MGNVFLCHTITTSRVRSMLCVCFYLHLWRPVCVCESSSPHILCQWLTSSLTSYLSYCAAVADYVSGDVSVSFILPPFFHLQTSAPHWSLSSQSRRPLRSVLTCNYDDKLHDSWKRFQKSLWMNMFARHMLSRELLCHGRRHSAEYRIFRSKDGKSVIFYMKS